MSRVLGWLRWLAAFLSTRDGLACLVRAHAAERLALKRQVLSLQADVALAASIIAGQRAEAQRMANATAAAQDELYRIQVQLGQKSMTQQEVPL